MAAGTVIQYAANLDDIRIADLVGATVKLSLHTSAYTPNAAFNGHALASELTNEISGGGYPAGGMTLASPTKTGVSGGWKFSSGNATQTATGTNIPAWRYGVIRVEGTVAGKLNPIIGYFLGDSTPADVPATTVGNPLTITCPAAGWFDRVVV